MQTLQIALGLCEFSRPSDAHLCAMWLTGDPFPDGWKLEPVGDGREHFAVILPSGRCGTLRAAAIRRLFPHRAGDLTARHPGRRPELSVNTHYPLDTTHSVHTAEIKWPR